MSKFSTYTDGSGTYLNLHTPRAPECLREFECGAQTAEDVILDIVRHCPVGCRIQWIEIDEAVWDVLKQHDTLCRKDPDKNSVYLLGNLIRIVRVPDLGQSKGKRIAFYV